MEATADRNEDNRGQSASNGQERGMRGSGYARRILAAMGLGLASLGICAAAQVVGELAPQNTGPSGSVSGTVYDQDTQHPVRLAEVMLTPVRDANDEGRRFGFFHGGGARTGMDGTFVMNNVGPGDYYVTATASGYISELALLQAQFNAGASADDLMKQVPTVHVSADGSATVSVTIQHGAAIGGRVQWEDGSAADDVQMQALPTATPIPLPSPLNSLPNFSATYSRVDDRGEFRIAGLAPGAYYVVAVVQSTASFATGRGSFSQPLRVYSPGVFRKTDAKPVTVRAGDERDDVQFVIDMSALRTVSGHVGSSVAGVSVRSGSVRLRDSVDTSLNPSGEIQPDGSFTVRFVPPGNYTVSVQGSSQDRTSGYRRGGPSSEPSATFQPYSQALLVGDTDVSGMAINLNAAASQ